MKVVYIVGPFRAKNHWGVEENIRKAERLALDVWRAGFAVVCPHTNTRFFDGAAPDRLWLDGDVEIMKRCDAVIIQTHGFETSAGSKTEVEQAIAAGIPVFYDIWSLLNHADTWWPGARWTGAV